MSNIQSFPPSKTAYGLYISWYTTTKGGVNSAWLWGRIFQMGLLPYGMSR